MIFSLLTLFLGCGDKEGIDNPVISIVSHSDGVEVRESDVEQFRAAVSSPTSEEVNVVWYLNDEIVLIGHRFLLEMNPVVISLF
jgi:hypothetical protein